VTREQIEKLEGRREQTMSGVREYCDGYPVELRRDLKNGRLLITAWNEGHNNMTQVDLWDLIEWLRLGPPEGRLEGGFSIGT
jgi:hypothetical protein